MQPKPDWESDLSRAAADAERELKRIVSYVNDRVVPEVRTRTAGAVQAVAGELRRLADRLDKDTNRRPGSAPAGSAPAGPDPASPDPK